MPKLKQNKSKTYWLKRAELDRNKAEQVGKNTIAELNRIYRANLKEIQAEYYALNGEESKKEFFLKQRAEFNKKNLDAILNTTLFFFLNKILN